jgi:uncharacterized protein YjdB
MSHPFRVTPFIGALCALATMACSGIDSGDPGIGPDSRLVISISPRTDSLAQGATRQMSAAISDGNAAARTAQLSWSSTTPSVASVSASGLVSAVAPGTARIIVRAGEAADSATIVVRANDEFQIEPNNISVPLGELVQLSVSSARTSAAFATSSVRWSTSDSTVATVNENGVVTTTGVGEATLTAVAGSASGSAAVSVKQNEIASIRITPANSSINAKTSEQLVATLVDANGRVLPGTVSNWSSSSPSTATVSSNGLVTGLVKGSVMITGRVGSKRGSATVNILDVPVATVTVSAPATTVSIGQTVQASATLKDADGNALTGRVISWQSSNPALATVNASGLVTGIAIGSFTLSAISDGKVGNLAMTVAAKPVASVTITPANGSAVVGQSAQLTANALDASGAPLAGKTFTWQSSDPSIATVSAAGLVTTLAVGTTTVSATTGGVTGTGTFTVTNVPVAVVGVQPSALQLTAGGTAQLAVTGTDAAGGSLGQRVAQWSSSNPTVATVSSSGVVTAVSKGAATVTATVDGVSGTASVSVAEPPPAPVASISVGLASASILVGQSTQATVTLWDADGNVLTGRSVSWSSTDPDLATVSTTGLVAALAAGSATIVASAEGQSGLASVTVMPSAPVPVATVSLSAPSTALTVGQTTQVTVVVRDVDGRVLGGRVVAWRSTNPGVASVNASGLVTAIANGSTTVEATSEGKTGTLGIAVSGGGPGPVATITLSASGTSLTVGQTMPVVATARDAAGTVVPNVSFSWSSSNSAVLGVSTGGVATAVAAGTAQVRATSGTTVGSLGMTVTAPAPPPPGPLAVVPGLSGFGVTTPAGRGGQVLRVTNLNDSGEGSLRAALSASGPRVVVFEVSGTITLASRISVSNPYLTVAGQTAPAPGISLRGSWISIRTHDVLIQHLRFRDTGDGLEILGPGGYNIVADHISSAFGRDENGSTWYDGVRDVTFSNFILNENLGSGALLVGDGTKNFLVVNTLFAHNQDRNPYFKGGTTGLMANSVVYNWGGNQAFYTADPEGSGASQVAAVGNLFLRGPSTPTGRPIQFYSSSKAGSKLYVAGNVDGRGMTPPADPWSLVKNDFGATGVATSPPVWPAGLSTQAPSTVYANVLAQAGAWPAARDAIDERIVGDVRNGTGRVATAVGTVPTLATTQRALAVPANPNGDDDGDGYTNLEEWLHAYARTAEGR